MTYHTPNYEEGRKDLNLANDRMMENAEDIRFKNRPSTAPMTSGYNHPIGIITYIANLNSTNDCSLWLNPGDYHDYFLFERGNNIYSIPEGYVNIGNIANFNFDGDEVAASEELDLILMGEING
jgi:hypothetical protein